MIFPARLFGSYKTEFRTYTPVASTRYQIADQAPNRLILTIGRIPNITGTPGSTTFTYFGPEGFALPNGGWMLSDTQPLRTFHARDFADIVGLAWYAWSVDINQRVSVCETVMVSEGIHYLDNQDLRN